MDKPIPPVIARLRTFPKDRPRKVPPGNKEAKLTKALATRFFDLLAESDKPIPQLLFENPDLPPFKTLFNWQQRVPWFAAMWKQARIKQTHFLADKCFDLYQKAEPKTAHVIRIKFDILKWLAAKFNPADYGDKISPPTQQTVNVGISISQDRLNDIRTKLNATRITLSKANQPRLSPNGDPTKALHSENESRTQ